MTNSFENTGFDNTVFRDLSILSPHYVPELLPFREEQVTNIMKVISPALQKQKPRNLFIYGKTGTGKTCSVKNVMGKFANASESVSIIYINCRIYNSRYRILQKVLKEFTNEAEKPGFGLPFLYEKMIEVVGKGHQLIVVLDEIDMIKDLDDLIYTLTRANDEIRQGGVSIIGISNKLSFKEVLDPRSRSSLYETEMVFPPYTSEQLQKILSERVKGGFNSDTVQPSAINLVAAITAQESGDARYALKLLMKAGEITDQNKQSLLTDKEVEIARTTVEMDLASETINTLPENHQLVLYAIASTVMSGTRYLRLDNPDGDVLISGEVYETYQHVCKKLNKKPRSLRWYREYLNDLEMLGLITTMPSSRGLRGHTTLIRLGYAPKEILKIVEKNLMA